MHMLMNSPFKGVITCLAAAALTLCVNGCVSTSQSSSAGNADPELVSDSGSFFSASGAASCAGGALFGALVGALACSSDNRAACAIGGAVGGCALGMTANYTLDSIRANYHNTEDRLNAVASAVKEDNDKLASLTEASRKILRRDQAEIATLERQIRAGTVSRDQLRAKVKKMDGNIAALQKNIDNLNARVAEHQQMRNDLLQSESGKLNSSSRQKLRELDTEIEKMRANISALNDVAYEYSADKARLSLGG